MGFKIYLDIEAVDLKAVLDKLKKLGDFILVNGILYIWLEEGREKKSLSSALKRAGVTEFYLQEITEDNVEQESGFPFAWAREHLNEEVTKSFEEKHQEELQKMLDNVKKVSDLLDERIKTNNKGG